MMNKRFRFQLLFLSLLVLVLRAGATESLWDQASNGQSSFLKLGPEFYEPVRVRNIPGAKLKLFSKAYSDYIGLTAKDQTELQRLVEEKFAVRTLEDHEATDSDRTMFATRYQDYADEDLEALGNPQGDGRAVWSGEIVLQTESGRTIYLDVSLKGVGRTPLARRAFQGNGNSQYSDGLQFMREAVRSFVVTNALFANGLLTSGVDLAVIELPIKKLVPGSKNTDFAAITVRIGRQTRLGHLQYFRKSRELFKKLLAYVVTRDLGLPIKKRIKNEELEEWLTQFTRNLAKQAAYYSDLNFVHGSLTAGNQTTEGSPIDWGTFMSWDVLHPNYKYLYDQLSVKNQVKDIREYIHHIFDDLYEAKYPIGDIDEKKFIALYRTEYTKIITNFRLQRLGLSEEEIALIPRKIKSDFNRAADDIFYASSVETGIIKEASSSMDAAFNLRSILSKTLKIYTTPDGDKDEMWINTLQSDRNLRMVPRSALLAPQPGVPQVPSSTPSLYERGRAYRDAVENILRVLMIERQRSPETLAAAVERAGEYYRNSRKTHNFGPPLRGTTSLASSPNTTWQEATASALTAANELVDRPSRVRPLHREAMMCQDAFSP